MRCRTKHETRKRTRTIHLRIATFQHRVGRGARPIMDFTHTGIKGMSPETSSTMSRVPSIDDERCQLSASIVADIQIHSSSAPLTTLCFTCFSGLHLPCGPDYRPEFCTCLNEGKLFFALSRRRWQWNARWLSCASTSVQLNCQRGFGFRSLQHRSISMVYDLKRDEGTVLRAVMSNVWPVVYLVFGNLRGEGWSVDGKMRSSVRIWTELSTRGLPLTAQTLNLG
jgi:hypothetical protein